MMGTADVAVFRVGDDAFGIPIERIQEIGRNLSFTPVFNADETISGVMNLRGQIVTIINLASKFGYSRRHLDERARVIIVNHLDEVVGLLVDEMHDIVSFDESALESESIHKDGTDPAFFKGIYQGDDELVILMDLDRVLVEAKENING